MRRWVVVGAMSLLLQGCSLIESTLKIGAVYPMHGNQAHDAIDEYRGVLLAAELANHDGGVFGQQVEVVLEEADSAEAAPGAIRRLAADDVQVVLGSYGSTISRPAAAEAARQEMIFWETGAVGEMGSDAQPGRRFFRMAATGATLGRAGVRFVQTQLLPRVGVTGARYAVAYVDDVYGRSVGSGAVDAIRSSGLRFVGRFPYRLVGIDYKLLARRIEAVRPDVLVVAAYLEDGIELRRALLRRQIPLTASIGTSSSYCMPDFGRALGKDAVGLFASDKPEADYLEPEMLSATAGRQLHWARAEYRQRYDEPMTAAALSGFASAVALFEHVLPVAGSVEPDEIAAAAMGVRLPIGSLPNGSGVRFAPHGEPDAGANLRAASVIWEWVRVNRREVVWPPSFATGPILAIRP